MKNFILLAAVAVLANPAFASKARMTALGEADHLVDAQSAFTNPAHLNELGEYATFEMGATTPGSAVNVGTTRWEEVENGLQANPGAEGGFLRTMGDAKMGFYLGRRSSFTDTYRRTFGFLRQDNPFEIQYAKKGDLSWGASFNYSSSDKKSTQQKQSAMGARFGAMANDWEAYLVLGLGSTATGLTATNAILADNNSNGVVDAGDVSAITADTNAKYTGTTGLKLGGAYKMGSMRIHGNYAMDGFKMDSSANATYDGMKVEANQLTIGATEVSKMDGGHWFYGASYAMSNQKVTLASGESKVTASYLPFIAGIEQDAASWMVLRASVMQNVLLGSYKSESGGTGEANTINNNTKVAAGVGLKFGKAAVDGSLAMKTTGDVKTDALMTNLGMTYNF